MPRQNTRIESEGAEFLVLGQLLIAGIPAYKAYTNMKGYDLVATNPDANTSARISVKSRWKTRAEGFIIKNFECDFVVIVKLNRGPAKIMPVEYFVLPVAYVKSLKRSKDWGKISFSTIRDMEKYRGLWGPIREFLARAPEP